MKPNWNAMFTGAIISLLLWLFYFAGYRMGYIAGQLREVNEQIEHNERKLKEYK